MKPSVAGDLLMELLDTSPPDPDPAQDEWEWERHARRTVGATVIAETVISLRQLVEGLAKAGK